MFRSLLAFLAISTFAGCSVSSEPTTTDEGTAAADEAAARSRICPLYYDPVCGVNGVTYSNTCFAGKTKIAHKGACNACDTTKCAAGTHCELQEIQCITFPCDPIAVCVKDAPADPCALVRCAAGTTCQAQPDGTAACVPAAKDSCTVDADCKIVSDYCGGCNCLPLATWASPPSCTDPVNCFADPCMNKTAACVNGQCVAQ